MKAQGCLFRQWFLLILAIAPVAAVGAFDGPPALGAMPTPIPVHSTAGSLAPHPFVCTRDERAPNAWYVGPYKGYDNNLTSDDMARDIYCAEQFKALFYPRGYVTIYGSSSLKEISEEQEPFAENGVALKEADIKKDYKNTYAQVYAFAHLWTSKYAPVYPIMTGGGPGLMEAGSRGAHEAGGPSIGYTTYYDQLSPTYQPGDVNVPAFARYPQNAPNAKEITSTGLIFSSVSIRETAMILHSAAIVIAPGGSGTEWEIFQILEMLKSKQLRPVPVYFMGANYHWYSLQSRIRSMRERGTIKKEQLVLKFVGCPEELFAMLALDLKLTTDAVPANVCAKKSPTEEKVMLEMNF